MGDSLTLDYQTSPECPSDVRVSVGRGYAESGIAAYLRDVRVAEIQAGAIAYPSPRYTHNQPEPATTWVINHNLGYRPTVQVFSSGGLEIDCDITHASINQVRIDLLVPRSGYAQLI